MMPQDPPSRTADVHDHIFATPLMEQPGVGREASDEGSVFVNPDLKDQFACPEMSSPDVWDHVAGEVPEPQIRGQE